MPCNPFPPYTTAEDQIEASKSSELHPSAVKELHLQLESVTLPLLKEAKNLIGPPVFSTRTARLLVPNGRMKLVLEPQPCGLWPKSFPFVYKSHLSSHVMLTVTAVRYKEVFRKWIRYWKVCNRPLNSILGTYNVLSNERSCKAYVGRPSLRSVALKYVAILHRTRGSAVFTEPWRGYKPVNSKRQK